MKKSILGLISCFGLVHTANTCAAGCVVGGSDFETSISLFNPSLSNDANGWFNDDVDDLLDRQCGSSCVYHTELADAKQLGLPSNTISTSASLTAKWSDFATKNIGNNNVGFAGVVANPRVISPYLNEGSGSNQFVFYGNGQSVQVLTYQVSGLAPNSTVTLDVDVYNLLSIENLEAAMEIMNEGVTESRDLVTEIKLARNTTFSMRSTGATLTSGSGKISSTAPQLSVSTSASTGFMASGNKKTTNGLGWGESQTLSFTAKADKYGNVTFYFTGSNSNFGPLAIDNLRIEGELESAIRVVGNPCPQMPAALRLNSVFPDGSTYSWKESKTGSTSKDATMIFFPPEPSDYSVSCTVTTPDGCVVTATHDLTVGVCCDDGNGNNMSLTDIYVDDFGRFSGSTYYYIDNKGQEQKAKAVDILGGRGTHGYCIDDRLNAGSAYAEEIKYAGKNFNKGGYAIATENAYENESSMFDASGEKGGAFLQIDMKGKGWMDKLVYERVIPGLCPERLISFSAAVGAINTPPRAGETNATIQVRLVNALTNEVILADGEPIEDTYVLEEIGWVEPRKSYEFKLPVGVDSVKIQIISKEDDYEPGQRGDIALDDIIFRVCTPPKVEVVASSNNNDLLNLCVDDNLVLEAKIEAIGYFQKPQAGYLFQVAKKDPDDPTFDPITDWIDLGEVQTENKYLIKDPATHFAFSGVESKTKVRFRVVVGELDYLKNQRDLWESLDEVSPCRNISFSTIPVEAAINCDECEPVDTALIISANSATKIKVNTKQEKEVVLCPGSVANLTTMPFTPKDPSAKGIKEGPTTEPRKYIASWHRGSKTVSGIPGAGYAPGDATSSYNVTWEDADWYYLLVKDMEFSGDDGKLCWRWDSIHVVAADKPLSKLKPQTFCAGTMDPEEEKTLEDGGTISGVEVMWYDITSASDDTIGKRINEPKVKSLEETTSYWYAMMDLETGCIGDIEKHVVTVNNADENPFEGEVTYKKTDAKQNGGRFQKKLNEAGSSWFPSVPTGSTLMIGLVNDAKSQDKPVLETVKSDLAPASSEMPIPELTAAQLEKMNDEYMWYYTYLESSAGCISDTLFIKVILKGAPTPNVTPDTFCVNSSNVKTFENYAKLASGTTGTLKFYNKDLSISLDPTDKPDVSTPGLKEYWVSQYDDQTGESDKVKLEFMVYDVADVTLSEATTQYCKDDVTKPLDDFVSSASSSDAYVLDVNDGAEFEYFKVKEPTSKVSSPGASSTMPIDSDVQGEKKYYARLKYKINSTEICYGEHQMYTVEVKSVDVPEVSAITYLKDDAVGGVYEKPRTKAPQAILTDESCTTCDIRWYSDENKSTQITENDATPIYNASLTGNDIHTYYVSQTLKLSSTKTCESKAVAVDIIVSGYPTPIVKDAEFCERSPLLTGNHPVEADVVPNGAVGEGGAKEDFDIIWYESKKNGNNYEIDETKEIGPNLAWSASTLDANADGSVKEHVFFVLQRLKTSTTPPYAQSAPKKVTIKIYPTPRLVAERNSTKCYGETQDLSKMYNVYPVECQSKILNESTGLLEEVGNIVTEGGQYQVRGFYKTEVSKEECKSAPQSLLVVFHKLEPKIDEVHTTCPGVAVDLTADAGLKVMDGSTTNSGASSVAVTYKWSNDKNANVKDASTATDRTANKYNTGNEGLVAGVTMNVKLTVSTDACPEGVSAVPMDILVGDGIRQGKYKFTEPDNTVSDNGLLIDDDVTFNSCGGTVTLDLTEVENINGGTYTITGDAGFSKTGSFSAETDGTASIALPDAGKYVMEYTNKCYTKFPFEIVDYGLNAAPTNDNFPICENNPWSAEITVTKSHDTPTFEWYKDGVGPMAGQTSNKLEFKPAIPENSGVYTYTLKSAGCHLDGEIAHGRKVVIRPYVKFKAGELADTYEVVNGNPITLDLKFDVPANASDIETAIEWNEQIRGERSTGSTMSIASVEKDYDFHIIAGKNSSDYCETPADVKILVDARLKMTATPDRDEICEGETATLTVDTAGTGKVLHPDDLVLIVTETYDGKSNDYILHNPVSGPIDLEIKPLKNAHYKVTYTYGPSTQTFVQDETKDDIDIIVHNAFQVETESDPVCGSDDNEAYVHVTKLFPSDTRLYWEDNGDEYVSGSGNDDGASFRPVHTGYGVAPQLKEYHVVATNGICQDKTFPVYVSVHKPLEGVISTVDKICQYKTLFLDASSFEAETYEWYYIEKDSSFTGATAAFVPDPTYATFSLKMTRGVCNLTEDKEVEITLVPVVYGIDSLGIRRIEIEMEYGAGTEPFKYIIDGKEDDPEVNNSVRDGLEYKEHMLKVVDAVGCETEFKFVVNNPAIEIPFLVSPDGNGVNDKFKVKGLMEGYPDAKVKIFDRWGKELASYRAGDGVDWDGVYNGSEMPTTDYWYEIHIEEINKTYTGHFALVRQ